MEIFNKGLILPPPLNFYLHFEDLQQGFNSPTPVKFLHSLKIFNKGLIISPPLNFYLHFEDLQQGFDDDDADADADADDDDDDDDALPVVVAVPGKAQAFAVYIYIIYIYICCIHMYRPWWILPCSSFLWWKGYPFYNFQRCPKKIRPKIGEGQSLDCVYMFVLARGGLWHFKKTKHVKQKSKAWTFQTCASWILEASRFVFYVYHPGAAFSLQKCRGVGPKGGRRAKWIARDFNLELIWSYILKWITRLISLILQSLKKVGEIAVAGEGLCWPVYPAARWRKGWADSHVSWF